MEQFIPAISPSVRYSYCVTGDSKHRMPTLVTKTRITPNTGWPESDMATIWRLRPNLNRVLGGIIEINNFDIDPEYYLRLLVSPDEIDDSKTHMYPYPWEYVCTVLRPINSTYNTSTPSRKRASHHYRQLHVDEFEPILDCLDFPIVTENGSCSCYKDASALGLYSAACGWTLERLGNRGIGYPTPTDILRAFREKTSHYGGSYLRSHLKFIDIYPSASIYNRLSLYFPVLLGTVSMDIYMPDEIDLYSLYEAIDTDSYPRASLVQSDIHKEPVGVLCTTRGVPKDSEERALFADYVWYTARTDAHDSVDALNPDRLYGCFGLTAQELLYTDPRIINEVIVAAYVNKYHPKLKGMARHML